MAIDQQRTAEPVEQQADLLIDGAVEGPMGLVEAIAELVRADRTAP
jgi:hypothetical protein